MTENEFQSTLLLFQRTLRWDAEAAGTSHLMVVVMGRWYEPKSSPTVHSVPVDQELRTTVMPGVLRPPVPLLMHVAVPSLRMQAFWEKASLLPIRCVGLPDGALRTVENGRLDHQRLGKGFLVRWWLGRECPGRE